MPIFQLFTLILGIVSIGFALFGKLKTSWKILVGIDLFLCGTLILYLIKFKIAKEKILPLLEFEAAREFFRQYAHYFFMPWTSRDLSASSATTQFLGAIIALIGLYYKFWIGILLAVVNWFIMGYVACRFSPVALIKNNPELGIIHDYILEFLTNFFQQK